MSNTVGYTAIALLGLIAILLSYIFNCLKRINWEIKYGFEERKSLRENLPKWEEHLKQLLEMKIEDIHKLGNEEFDKKWEPKLLGEHEIPNAGKELQDIERVVDFAHARLRKKQSSYEWIKDLYD